MKAKKHLIALAECGVMIALSVALSFLKIPLWGNGGSIDFVSIPILLLAFHLGAGWGIASGAVFGFIKCLIGGGIGWGIGSVLLDYVLAYALLGLCGFFKGKGRTGLMIGTVVGCFGRFVSHFLSGVLLWRIATGETEELFGATFSNSELYSLVYNGSYMLANCIIAFVVLLLIYPLLVKANVFTEKK